MNQISRIFENVVEIGYEPIQKAFVLHLRNTEIVTKKQIKALDRMGYDIIQFSIFSGGSIKIVLKSHNRLVLTLFLVSAVVWLLLLV